MLLSLDRQKVMPGAAGVRYPPHLLQEVVATLSSAQQQASAIAAAANEAHNATTQQQQHPAAAQHIAKVEGELDQQALRAAAMGAARQVRLEPVSAVDPKSVAKAFRWVSKISSGVVVD